MALTDYIQSPIVVNATVNVFLNNVDTALISHKIDALIQAIVAAAQMTQADKDALIAATVGLRGSSDTLKKTVDDTSAALAGSGPQP